MQLDADSMDETIVNIYELLCTDRSGARLSEKQTGHIE